MYLFLPVALKMRHCSYANWIRSDGRTSSGLFGVGRGFLMTPLHIMMGISVTVAAATDSNQIIVALGSGFGTGIIVESAGGAH